MQLIKSLTDLLFGSKSKNNEQYIAFANELLNGNMDKETIKKKVVEYIATMTAADQKNFANVLGGMLTNSQTTGNAKQTEILEMVMGMLNNKK